jgi:uncharacterized protein YbcI
VTGDPNPGETGAAPRHSVAARISRDMVRLVSQYVGRGPTKARTSLNSTFALVVLEDSLTKAERNLVAAGLQESVHAQRRTFQSLMRDEAIAAVEAATGRRVRAFLSDFSAEEGISAELFLFESSDTDDGAFVEVEVDGDGT